jgi:hypothetical protein
MDANLNLQARRPEPVNVDKMSVPDKLTQAMQQSVGKLPSELQQQMQQLLKPEALAVLGGVAATWGALQVVGGPFAVAADVALLGAGYAALGASAVTASQELCEFVQKASQAQNSQQLDQAASHFAKFVSIVGVDVVATLVGTRAGRVAEDLGQLVKNSSARLGELTGETQRLAGTLVKGGNELWQSAGQRLGKVGDDLGRTLDNASESMGIQRPQAATAGGPQLPANQPMQMQGASTGAGATALQKLQQTGIEASSIRALEQQGLNPQQLERFVNEVRQSGHTADELPKIVETLKALTEQGIDLGQAQTLLKTAPPKAVRAIESLMLGKGKLDNPQALPGIVEKLNNGLKSEKPDVREAAQGLLSEIQVAAKHVEQGSRVQLGAVSDPSITPERIAQVNEIRRQAGEAALKTVNSGGDVVDFTRREVLQIKRVSSPQSEAVLTNLKSAERQLQGSKGELPHEGFKKVAEIYIGPNNELFKANGQAINQQITKLMKGGELKDFDGTVRIVKANEQGIAAETLEFRVQNGRSQYSPSPTQPNKQSSLEPIIQTASAAVAPAVAYAQEQIDPFEDEESDNGINEWLQAQIDANRERYPLPQLRTPQALNTTISDRNNPPQSPRESLESNPSLHDTLSRLNNVIDELDRQTLARQPQPSPAQRLYEKTAQGITQQTGLTPGHDRFEPVLAAKLLAEHGYHQAASIIAAGSPRLNEVNATFGSTTADRQLAELMKQGEQTLQAMRPEQQKQQDQMEQG